MSPKVLNVITYEVREIVESLMQTTSNFKYHESYILPTHTFVYLEILHLHVPYLFELGRPLE